MDGHDHDLDLWTGLVGLGPQEDCVRMEVSLGGEMARHPLQRLALQLVRSLRVSRQAEARHHGSQMVVPVEEDSAQGVVAAECLRL